VICAVAIGVEPGHKGAPENILPPRAWGPRCAMALALRGPWHSNRREQSAVLLEKPRHEK